MKELWAKIWIYIKNIFANPLELKMAAATAGGFLSKTLECLFGDINEAFAAVWILFFIDLFLGLCKAWKAKDIDSSKLEQSVYKGIAYSILLIVGVQAGRASSFLFWISGSLIFVMVVTEIQSILENLTLLEWFRPPLWLKDKILKLKEKDPFKDK